MAGSYRHAVTDDGRLLAPQHIGIACENDGDSYETVEEFYGMVWLLAGGDADRVEKARQNYKAGLAMSPGIGAVLPREG